MNGIVLGLFLFLVFPVYAAELSSEPADYLLQSPTPNLTIEEVSALPQSQFGGNSFVRSASNEYWLRIEIPEKRLDSSHSWFLQIDFPNIDKVDVFVRQPGSDGWTSYRVGDDTPFSNWPVDFRVPTIPLGNSLEAPVYARVISFGEFAFPLKLVTEAELEQQIRDSNSYYSAIFSALFVLIITNFFLYLFIRDSSYFYYVVYISAFAAVQLGVTGLGQQLFWPELDGATTRIALIAIAITNLFLPLFAIQYLSLQNVAPRLSRFMRFCAALPMALLPLLLLENYNYAQISLHLISTLNMILVMFISLKRTLAGDRPAAYMSVSYGVLFYAIALALLHQNRLIGTGFWVQHMMELAIVFEALLLSIGLADRINRIRLENIRMSEEKKEDQQRFYKALISVEEKEKSRLGRLLHDGVSHDLLLLKNQVNKTLPDNERPEFSIQIDQVIEKVRDISHLIHPFHLEQLGFTLAAEQLIESTFRDTDIESMAAIAELELPRHIESELFHALQECLNNIIKHSGASEALIRVDSETVDTRQQVVLVAKDDGAGFDAGNHHEGMGLRMIKESIESLGGMLTINTTEGDGTEVRLCVPVEC